MLSEATDRRNRRREETAVKRETKIEQSFRLGLVDSRIPCVSTVEVRISARPDACHSCVSVCRRRVPVAPVAHETVQLVDIYCMSLFVSQLCPGAQMPLAWVHSIAFMHAQVYQVSCEFTVQFKFFRDFNLHAPASGQHPPVLLSAWHSCRPAAMLVAKCCVALQLVPLPPEVVVGVVVSCNWFRSLVVRTASAL